MEYKNNHKTINRYFPTIHKIEGNRAFEWNSVDILDIA